jgi:hypothetical protein
MYDQIFGSGKNLLYCQDKEVNPAAQDSYFMHRKTFYEDDILFFFIRFRSIFGGVMIAFLCVYCMSRDIMSGNHAT